MKIIKKNESDKIYVEDDKQTRRYIFGVIDYLIIHLSIPAYTQFD